MGRVENWKARMKIKYDSQSSPCDCTQDVEIEIFRETLGERRSHEQGVGRKLKGQSSRRRSQPTAATDQPDLRKTVTQMQR
uniref:Uncharacterized protein n=1 Tax=Cannabis sativa TaxID=3483 RepID=A0A803Q4K5_CANSA